MVNWEIYYLHVTSQVNPPPPIAARLTLRTWKWLAKGCPGPNFSQLTVITIEAEFLNAKFDHRPIIRSNDYPQQAWSRILIVLSKNGTQLNKAAEADPSRCFWLRDKIHERVSHCRSRTFFSSSPHFIVKVSYSWWSRVHLVFHKVFWGYESAIGQDYRNVASLFCSRQLNFCNYRTHFIIERWITVTQCRWINDRTVWHWEV